MGKFTIDAPALRQALTTAMAFTYTGKEPLEALRAVHIEPTDDGAVEMAATDRYVLSAETIKADGEPFEFTMPYAAAKELVRMIPRPKRNAEWNGTVTFTQDGVMVVAHYANATGSDASTKFAPVDSAFPKYQSLFGSVDKAQPEPVDTVTFSPQIVGRVFKALADRDDFTPVKLEFRGSVPKPVLVTQGDTFRALVMRPPAT